MIRLAFALEEEYARRNEAINQVDSAFGVLLVISVFSWNLYMSSVLRFVAPQAFGVTLFFLGTELGMGATILIGLYGILKRDWIGKFLSWWFSFFFVILAAANLFYEGVFEYAYSRGLSILAWHPLTSFVALSAAILPSYFMTSRWVIKAYKERILLVSCQDDQLEVAARTWFRVFLPLFVLIVVLDGIVTLVFRVP